MIYGLLLGFQFFTRIPVNSPIELNDKNIRYALFFLPLIGALMGVIAAGIYYILLPYNILIGALLSLLSLIVLTGGLHLDGLSDTFDGFMANRDREKTLEIMKDSRIGAFGVLSIVLIIMSKYIFFISIENAGIPIILSLINSRMVLGYVISFKKSARNEGLGYMFHRSKPKNLWLISALIYTFVLLINSPEFLIPLGATLLSAELVSRKAYGRINGLTGDIYGTIIEIGEVVSLIGFWSVSVWI